ncbi:glycosyltransferase [Spirilliplanes yamanashiensis]|uniref:Glycosyl transferase n=1 Tax=Spirilliplanes yamanashiensis TaxID=42233 RepID=A0A8J3Y601_9ACTN|nr:glycosyltransferase [Spirilliplanes yamanashiensis]MDP9814749.1 glycosyltransferase involved in cell wall biosynthesis [Spirilliplanes yamanashiensis]GIJ02403.1 glycosyl transferase [Spirilliplanes yamanashiensis]
MTGTAAGRSVALVHEWFGATGGSENVFLAMSEAFPGADGYVLWRDRDARRGLQYRESWLARTPLRHSKAAALPVMPLAWRTLTRRSYDVVLSSSHAFAHTVKLGSSPDTRYLSYVHSPARYLWSPEFDARGSTGLLAGPRRALRAADVRLSRHVHGYAANSCEVRARIRRYWGRDARVINPPVDVDYFAAADGERGGGGYLLGVGRWIPYKNFDLIIEIADAAGLPVVIAGSGPEEAALRRLAERVRVPVTFEVRPPRERLRERYRGAAALLFPAHEDFGIIPVEAMACGTPVVGLRRGGLLETVVDGETGYLLDSRDPADHAAAVRAAAGLDPQRIAKHAETFSAEVFRERLTAWVADEAG